MGLPPQPLWRVLQQRRTWQLAGTGVGTVCQERAGRRSGEQGQAVAFKSSAQISPLKSRATFPTASHGCSHMSRRHTNERTQALEFLPQTCPCPIPPRSTDPRPLSRHPGLELRSPSGSSSTCPPTFSPQASPVGRFLPLLPPPATPPDQAINFHLGHGTVILTRVHPCLPQGFHPAVTMPLLRHESDHVTRLTLTRGLTRLCDHVLSAWLLHPHHLLLSSCSPGSSCSSPNPLPPQGPCTDYSPPPAVLTASFPPRLHPSVSPLRGLPLYHLAHNPPPLFSTALNFFIALLAPGIYLFVHCLGIPESQDHFQVCSRSWGCSSGERTTRDSP